MQASVVVPTYKRPELLRRCLESLSAQDFNPSEFEILIADDAASAATRSQVEEFARSARPVVRYLAAADTQGPAAARNLGWRSALGRVIAFTDDDCIPRPSWLSEGVRALGGGAEAAAGRVVVPLPEVPTDYELDASGLETAEFVTANCFCRRSALEAVGGFDERFRAAWREDSDLHFALLGAGMEVVRTAAEVVHPVRPAPWGVSLRQQRKTAFDALLYKKHPVMYRGRIRPAPPWDYFAIVASPGLAALALAVGLPAAAAVPLGAWALLTARFFSRRIGRTSRAPGHLAEMAVTSILIPPLSVFWRIYGSWKYRVIFL